MVLYEDDCKGKLYLTYDNIPFANEVVRDILDAPIDNGKTYQNKRRKLVIKDKYVVIAAELGSKIEESVVSELKQKRPDWKAIKIGNKLGFELPDEIESEQQNLMEK